MRVVLSNSKFAGQRSVTVVKIMKVAKVLEGCSGSL